MAYGVRRAPSSRARPVGSSFTPQASPEHVGVYPVPITMATSGSFFFTPRRSMPRFGPSVPGHRLDEPSRSEVRTELGDVVLVLLGSETLRDVLGAVAGVEVDPRQHDHVAVGELRAAHRCHAVGLGPSTVQPLRPPGWVI